MFDHEEDAEEGIGFLGQATNEYGGGGFNFFQPRRDRPFGGMFTLPGMQTTAPSPSSIVSPRPQLKRPIQVDPRAALWRFEAQVKKCPTCPSQIIATESSSGLITAEQAWQQAQALKSKTKAQWIIARRQRKQGEPKSGEWFTVWIPTATLAHLKNLEP